VPPVVANGRVACYFGMLPVPNDRAPFQRNAARQSASFLQQLCETLQQRLATATLFLFTILTETACVES
jgi:hypothetical protein